MLPLLVFIGELKLKLKRNLNELTPRTITESGPGGQGEYATGKPAGSVGRIAWLRRARHQTICR